jgi:hypothetical protein
VPTEAIGTLRSVREDRQDQNNLVPLESKAEEFSGRFRYRRPCPRRVVHQQDHAAAEGALS